MAEPRHRFISRDPENPVKEVSLTDLTGENVVVKFKDGVFETTDPGLVTAALGSDAITGAGDPYTHTITSNNSPQWLGLWTKRPLTGASVEWDKFDDCFIKGITIQYAAGKLLQVQCDFLGRLATGVI